MMRALKIAAVALALALTSPGLAAAQESLAAGAAAGALAGGLAGGPVGAAIGGAVGAAIGGAAQTHVPVAAPVPVIVDYGGVAEPRPRWRMARHYSHRHLAYWRPRRYAARHYGSWRTAYVRPRPARVRAEMARRFRFAARVVERTCVRDRAGNQTCREVIR